MPFIVITLFLAAALAINHAVHGEGCWGLQPGGAVSATIYDVQFIISVTGAAWLTVASLYKTIPQNWLRLSVIGCFVLASVASFMVFGWRIGSSVQNQGAENWLAYITAAATTYLIGRYPKKHNTKSITREDNSFASPNSDRTTTDNPYEPPQNPS